MTRRPSSVVRPRPRVPARRGRPGREPRPALPERQGGAADAAALHVHEHLPRPGRARDARAPPCARPVRTAARMMAPRAPPPAVAGGGDRSSPSHRCSRSIPSSRVDLRPPAGRVREAGRVGDVVALVARPLLREAQVSRACRAAASSSTTSSSETAFAGPPPMLNARPATARTSRARAASPRRDPRRRGCRAPGRRRRRA